MQTVFSNAEENYIKAVFHLQKQAKAVSTNALAGYMNTKPASVTDMLKKLKVKKILDYQPYYGVRLTSAGQKVALSIVRRHRLWEFFLVNTLGFQWDEVHEIAEQLEHVNHPALIEKLDYFLNRPPFDPHGDPIPDQHGKMAEVTYQPLSEMGSAKEVIFASVGQQTPELMSMLNHKKIGLGDKIKVVEKFDFDQSIEVLVNGQQPVSLSYRLAKFILVNPVNS